MSEKMTRIDDMSKAWDMAYAEKPFRDRKLGFIAMRKGQFAGRMSEIKNIAGNPSRDISEIQPNEDEVAYANTGLIKTEGGYYIGEQLSTNPLHTAKIAKALIEQADLRAQGVLEQQSNHELIHPGLGKLEDAKQAVMQAQRHYENQHRMPTYGIRPLDDRGVDRAMTRLAGMLRQRVVDPSRSVAGDKAAEAAAKKYDERQRIKQELDSGRSEILDL